jgi:hypothetical protein
MLVRKTPNEVESDYLGDRLRTQWFNRGDRPQLDHEMHNCEVHAYERHACKIHAHETYAYEVYLHTREMHACEIPAHEIHTREMHTGEIYARRSMAFWGGGFIPYTADTSCSLNSFKRSLPGEISYLGYGT